MRGKTGRASGTLGRKAPFPITAGGGRNQPGDKKAVSGAGSAHAGENAFEVSGTRV